MYTLSQRCKALRSESVDDKRYMSHWGLQRHLYYLLGSWEAMEQKLTNTEIVASGICRALESFDPVIIPGELVVGFTIGEGKHYPVPSDESELIKAMKENGVSEEDIRKFLDFRTAPPEFPNALAGCDYTLRENQAEEEHSAMGRSCTSNHSVIGYEKILKYGFSGMLDRVLEAEKHNGELPMYRAMKRICRSACMLGTRYARKAKELLHGKAEGYDPEDLMTIISVCSNVPWKPAATFLEAVQSLFLAHIVNTWEDDVNANSLGRLDQILYPYYSADIQKGILTREQAFEIICCLWIKLYRDYDVQQSCIGGTDADGVSQVNDLSYLMLDATEALDFIRCLSVRFSSHTEKEFLSRALEVTGHVGKGVPFYFNDDVMIPALMYKNIPLEDACGYTQIGCVETVIPGKSNPHAVSGQVNVLKALEYLFCNGRSMLRPEVNPGLDLGSLDAFTTYDKLYEAVKQQMANLFELSCCKIKKSADAACINDPKPYKSLLTEGCIERGLDFNQRGALYDYYHVCILGIPNLADSLAVIKKFVYEDKTYTLSELKDILEADFPDEAVRLEFINKAPKYGNDIPEVDSIAADIMDVSCDMLDRMSEKYQTSFHAQPFTFLWMIDHGHLTGASPDGRRKGDPLAYSCSAMQGRDYSGLTALLNSISAMPAAKAPGTVSAIVETDPKLFCDNNLELMTDALAAAGKNGLCNVQFNIVDADTLIDAQKHPEHYNNLAVRVSGFSQKFNLLSKELQDHIIGRTKHQCL